MPAKTTFIRQKWLALASVLTAVGMTLLYLNRDLAPSTAVAVFSRPSEAVGPSGSASKRDSSVPEIEKQDLRSAPDPIGKSDETDPIVITRYHVRNVLAQPKEYFTDIRVVDREVDAIRPTPAEAAIVGKFGTDLSGVALGRLYLGSKHILNRSYLDSLLWHTFNQLKENPDEAFRALVRARDALPSGVPSISGEVAKQMALLLPGKAEVAAQVFQVQ